MKRKTIIILAIILLQIAILVGCSSEKMTQKFVPIEGGFMLKEYTGTSTDIYYNVPEKWKNLPVISLGEFAIANANYLETLNIGKSIVEIHPVALLNLPSLKEINVDIENPNFTSIEGVLYNKAKDILLVYPNAKGKEYVIPDGIRKINDNAFYKCVGLENISIPQSVTEISDRAFMRCSLKEIILPDNLLIIGRDAFSFNEKATTIFIPKSVETIGDFGFFGCINFTEISMERASQGNMRLGKNWQPYKIKTVSTKVDVVWNCIRK